MDFETYLLIAGIVILLAALICVVFGIAHLIREGSPAGAIALLLGLIVIAIIVGREVFLMDMQAAFSELPKATPPTS